jgi:adenosylmethionine-8-amino-7-oxononanoate aminotransferase
MIWRSRILRSEFKWRAVLHTYRWKNVGFKKKLKWVSEQQGYHGVGVGVGNGEARGVTLEEAGGWD